VSTCNRKRTALAFCTVSCWDAHLPVARHRESWAEEQTAPREPEKSENASASASPSAGSEAPKRRRIVRPDTPKSDGIPREVLIVTSRLKDYVRARAGFSSSDRVLGPLSEIVRRVCDEAIANASREGRKTILDRDIPDM
jgi:histone H3/H4